MLEVSAQTTHGVVDIIAIAIKMGVKLSALIESLVKLQQIETILICFKRPRHLERKIEQLGYGRAGVAQRLERST